MNRDHYDSPDMLFMLICSLLVLAVVLVIMAYNQADTAHAPTINTLAPAVYQTP